VGHGGVILWTVSPGTVALTTVPMRPPASKATGDWTSRSAVPRRPAHRRSGGGGIDRYGM